MQPTVWIALGVASVALVLALWSLLAARAAYRRLAEVTPDVRGLAQRVRGKSSEEVLAGIFTQLNTTGQQMDELKVEMTELERVMSRALRRVGLVRYDSNDEIRGNLSFALCMLDGRDNGLMLTSNYSLDGCRVFVRGILAGKAQHDLMPEEAEALAQALSER